MSDISESLSELNINFNHCEELQKNSRYFSYYYYNYYNIKVTESRDKVIRIPSCYGRVIRIPKNYGKVTQITSKSGKDELTGITTICHTY